MRIIRFSQWTMLVCLVSVLTWQSFGLLTVRAAGAGSSAADIQANGLYPVATQYSGPLDLVAQMNLNTAQPLSLAAADLDEDGIEDVVAGYRPGGWPAGGGILSVQRGNSAAIYPYGAEGRAMRAAGAFTDALLLPEARLSSLPDQPTFLQAADFDGDGHADVLAGAAGSSALYLLTGDGQGQLSAPRRVELPGQLSALKSGEFDAHDGVVEILAGLNSPAGPRILIIASPFGALSAASTRVEVPLPGPVVDMTLAQYEDDPRPSLAVITPDDGAASTLTLVHGRSMYPAGEAQGVPAAETRALAFRAAGLAAGRFQAGEVELAILAEDGSLFVANPNKRRTQPLTVDAAAAQPRQPWARPISACQKQAVGRDRRPNCRSRAPAGRQ